MDFQIFLPRPDIDPKNYFVSSLLKDHIVAQCEALMFEVIVRPKGTFYLASGFGCLLLHFQLHFDCLTLFHLK